MSKNNDMILNFIDDEIRYRAKVLNNNTVIFERIDGSVFKFPLPHDKTIVDVLKEKYVNVYDEIVDMIFDELHPY